MTWSTLKINTLTAHIILMTMFSTACHPPGDQPNISDSRKQITRVIHYTDRSIRNYESNPDNLIDWECYPDLPCWTGEIKWYNSYSNGVLELQSRTLQNCITPWGPVSADWNAIFIASHSNYKNPTVRMEAEILIPAESMERGVGIELNPETFLSNRDGNTNQFAQMRVFLRQGRGTINYIGENDSLWKLDDLQAITADEWHHFVLEADFSNNRYVSMAIDDKKWQASQFVRRFTTRSQGAGDHSSIIGFWIGNKAHDTNPTPETDIRVNELKIVITI